MGKQPKNPSADILRVTTGIFLTYWPVMVAGLLFLATQLPVLKNWWAVWNEPDSYYSHGPLVPAIAAFMIWTNRNKLADTPVRNSWLGLALLIAFLPIHAIGLLMGFRALYGVAFFFCLYGIILMLFGKRVMKIVFIPVLFLVTMIPVASWMLDNATGRFQLISATVATKLLQLTAPYNIEQFGNTIYSEALPGAHTLLVGSPCSGLRLLISLVTFSWFFVYVTRTSWWKKGILLALSFPLSIFINSLRITMIGYVGFWTESSEAMHTFHDYSGYIGLVICFVLLFGIAKLMRVGDFVTGGSVPGAPLSANPYPKPVGMNLHGILVCVILVVGIVASTCLTPLYDLPKGKINRSAVPISFGHWSGVDAETDPLSKELLSQGDLMTRIYTDTGETGRQVSVFLDASLDVSAFHDPHLCLPGGGQVVTNERVLTISFAKPKPVTVKATILQAESEYGSHLVAYWYMLKDKSFPRTSDVYNQNRRHKADDLRRLLVSPSRLSELRDDIHSRQFMWYRFTTEIYDESTDEKWLIGFIREYIANFKGFGE